jgi:hypothetical protein
MGKKNGQWIYHWPWDYYIGRNSIDAIEFLPESFSESFSFSQTSVLSPPFDRSPS